MGSPDKGLKKALSLQERKVKHKNEQLFFTFLMGKRVGDVLINKISVLLQKVMPPLLLGYVIWDHTLVAEIYHTLH